MVCANQWICGGPTSSARQHPAVEEFAGKWPLLLDAASQSVRAVFQMKDEVFGRMRANADGCIACAVSDPLVADCPLVFLSRGFEQMTGYDCEFGLGRNCRFLQPADPELNKRLNGDQLGRMRDFCQVTGTPGAMLVSLLLNETRSGERFWNLLRMEHVDVGGRPYILGVQTILELHLPPILSNSLASTSICNFTSSLLSSFIDTFCLNLRQTREQLQSTRDASMANLANLATERLTADGAACALLPNTSRKAATVARPAATSMARARPKALSRSVAPQWLASAEQWIRDGCSLKGDAQQPAVQRFAGKWPMLLEAASHSVQALFQMKEALLSQTGASAAGGVVCAVSDPTTADCPIVFVSRGFEQITGYDCQYSLGRNCRFLQPTDSWLNQRINGEELERMRSLSQQRVGTARKLVSLVLNERRDGERFWNLVHLEHVEVGAEPFILGVQARLELPMPPVLASSAGCPAFLASAAEGLAPPLGELRRQLRAGAGDLDQAAEATECLVAYLKQLCSECDSLPPATSAPTGTRPCRPAAGPPRGLERPDHGCSGAVSADKVRSFVTAACPVRAPPPLHQLRKSHRSPAAPARRSAGRAEQCFADHVAQHALQGPAAAAWQPEEPGHSARAAATQARGRAPQRQ